jgi:hypothetical protein
MKEVTMNTNRTIHTAAILVTTVALFATGCMMDDTGTDEIGMQTAAVERFVEIDRDVAVVDIIEPSFRVADLIDPTLARGIIEPSFLVGIIEPSFRVADLIDPSFARGIIDPNWLVSDIIDRDLRVVDLVDDRSRYANLIDPSFRLADFIDPTYKVGDIAE